MLLSIAVYHHSCLQEADRVADQNDKLSLMSGVSKA